MLMLIYFSLHMLLGPCWHVAEEMQCHIALLRLCTK